MVPIEFCDLLSDDEWTPFALDAESPLHHWHLGGELADARIDVAATFAGAMDISTKVDPSFNAYGLRCRPAFTYPRSHRSLRHLVIVFGGHATVEWGEDGGEGHESFTAGEFWVTDPDTPYTFTAGDEGLVYVETWSEPIERLVTWWHDHGWAGAGPDVTT